MDPLFIVGIVLVAVNGTYLVLTQLAARRRRQRERAFAALLDLAADAFEAELNRSAGSPDGQSPRRLGCDCSRCEKARQAAEEQNRGEQ